MNISLILFFLFHLISVHAKHLQIHIFYTQTDHFHFQISIVHFGHNH